MFSASMRTLQPRERLHPAWVQTEHQVKTTWTKRTLQNSCQTKMVYRTPFHFRNLRIYYLHKHLYLNQKKLTVVPKTIRSHLSREAWLEEPLGLRQISNLLKDLKPKQKPAWRVIKKGETQLKAGMKRTSRYIKSFLCRMTQKLKRKK